MRKLVVALVLFSIVAIALSACGGSGGGAAGPGDVARGKALYNQKTLGKKSTEGCVTCHNYDESQGAAEKAPYTKGTGTRAATRVPGLSAEEYVKESILKPDAYVVEGFKAGDMYQKWGEDLTPQQINDLVAYILSER